MYLAKWMLSLLLAAACGSVQNNDRDAAIDSIDSPNPDAPPDASLARCDPSKAFGAPVPLPGVGSTAVEADGWMSHDELTLYFRSARPGGLGAEDLYVATRATTAETFANISPLTTLNSAQYENSAVLTEDGLDLFLSSTRVNGTHDIYIASRSNVAAQFGAPTAVANVNNPTADDIPGFIAPDGTALYFTSNRSGNHDIYMSTRANRAMPFGAPTAVTALNSTEYDFAPVLGPGQLSVFVQSQRAGGFGQTDVWRATRTATTEAFGTPTNVAELSTAANDAVTWVSDDGCVVLLTSNRPGGAGAFDIWIASRSL